MQEKVATLIELLEDGDLRLIANRKKKMERLRRDFERYGGHGLRDIDQGELELG